MAYHLLRHHHDGLRGELSTAVIEEIFQAGSEEIDDENIVQAFLAKVVNIGDARWKNPSACETRSTIDAAADDSRQPTRILYVRYSSRN